MRILFIAPGAPGISWSQEIELISRWHQLTPILGTVTQERLTTATTGARFDIIHIAAHGSSAGIAITDGTLTKEQLGQIARQVRADLVFLNACDSARLGQFLVDTGTPATIAYTVPTLDADALGTAAYYYEELAEHDGDFRVAYYRATPADGTLCWFSDGSFVDRLIKPLISQLQTLAAQFHTFRQQS